MNTSSETNASTPESRISATLVPEGYRLGFLPCHFGRLMLQVEATVYYQMGVLASSYTGGYWEFVGLSNGGAFMYPKRAELQLWSPNGFGATVTGEVAGIIATLYALSHLSFKYPHEDAIAGGFHALRDFALEHPNARDILAAID